MSRLIVVVGLSFLMSGFGLAANELIIQEHANGFELQTSTAHAGATVMLSSNDDVQRYRFAANEPIIIPTLEADGLFKVEVVLTPRLTADQKRHLAEDRSGIDIFSIDANQNVIAGIIRIQQGQLVSSTREEAIEEAAADQDLPLRDQVFNDDLIVSSSLCVGFDCANGESFGSDTVRLKENNLRIHFDDTSNSASFPGNDWRLVANDQTNGGANLFALEDSTAGRRIVVFEAGAPANSLYLEDDGDIGLGTTVPVMELHMVDGDTPTVRLEQNGSGGFGSQIWDLAGNETNFFVRDASNSSQLPFRIFPGASTGDSVVIDAQGEVGIGTSTVAATLHVSSRNSGRPAFLVQAGSPAVDLLSLADSGDMVLSGTLAQLSRRDSKEHFRPIDHQMMLTALKKLNISTWNYKHQPDTERHLGPVAEEFYAVYKLGTDADHIATSDMAAVALASSQALLAELESKDQRINELEGRLQRLETLLEAMLDQQDDHGSRHIVSR